MNAASVDPLCRLVSYCFLRARACSGGCKQDRRALQKKKVVSGAKIKCQSYRFVSTREYSEIKA
jgi:hypothetical protein